MALARAVAALLALAVGSVLLAAVTPEAPRPVTHVIAGVPAPTTTSTVAPPPTTTTTLVTPARSAARASRGSPHRSAVEGLPDQHRAATAEEQAAVIAEIYKYDDWPADEAVTVARCESGLKWWRIGDSNPDARGVFQILHGALDLVANVAHAHWLYLNRNGWAKWRASRSCHHLV